MIFVIIIMIVTLKVYGSCEAVLSKRSKKAQPRRCLLSLQVRYEYHDGDGEFDDDDDDDDDPLYLPLQEKWE